MNKTQAFDFLEKFAANRHTAQEQQHFRQWLMTADEESISEVTMQYEDLIGRIVVDEQPDAQLIGRIEARLDQTDKVTTPVRRMPVWVRYAAAAAVLFVVCGLWFVVDRSKQHAPVQVAQSTSKDILPGNNRATLTLSDGSTVVLDSTTHNNTVKDGNTVINKAQGQISYASNTARANTTIAYNILATPRGGQYQLVLPDGSKVWLNAASSIRYPTEFAGNARRVEVTGEAYFEVAQVVSEVAPRYGRPESRRRVPFIVNVNGKAEVEVLGTHFNVNAYDDEESIKTTLLEGKVKVSVTGGSRLPTIDSRLLSPGQQALVNKNTLQLVNNPDLEETMAWKHGFFQFKSASVPGILRQVARWYDVDIAYAGSIPDEYLTGIVPRTANVSKILEVLETTGTMHFDIQDRKIIVSAKKQPSPGAQ